MAKRLKPDLINGAWSHNPGGDDEISWWSPVDTLLPLVVAVPSNLVVVIAFVAGLFDFKIVQKSKPAISSAR